MCGLYIWIADGVDSELDREFREVIYKLNQMNRKTNEKPKKITLKGSLEEAVREWIRKKNQELMLSGDIKR